MKKSTAVLALLFVIAGCATPTRPATPLEGFFVRDDFKGPQLAQGGMVVGGIVTEPGKFALQPSEEVSPLIIKAFHLERRYLSPQPTTKLRAALGQKRYTEVMTQFAKGELADNILVSIGTALPDTRYLVLARVDENRDGGTATFRRDHERSAVLKDQPYTLYVRHYRTMAVTMTIYDLQSRTIAFSGHLKDDVGNSLAFEGGNDPHTLVGWFVSGKQIPETHVPPMPSTNELLPYFFIAFATNLPNLN